MKKEAVRINDIMKTHQKTQQWTQIYTNNSQPYKNTFNLVYFADPVSIKRITFVVFLIHVPLSLVFITTRCNCILCWKSEDTHLF